VVPNVENRITQLAQEIREHNFSYYVEDEATISDADYDKLFQELLEIERLNPKLVTSESPTHRVGAPVRTDFKAVAHTYPMLSLSNVFDFDELKEFDLRVKRHLGLPENHRVDYVVEPKVDGVGLELVYRDGLLVVASTRGDGHQGEDVTVNAKTIRSIPLKVRGDVPSELEIRGEVFFPKQKFADLNQRRSEQGLSPFANPRNATGGSLRNLDPGVTASRPLRAYFYSLSKTPETPSTHQKLMTWLAELGFPVFDIRLCSGITQVQEAYAGFVRGRDTMPYEIDGVVIKVNEHHLQIDLGQVSRAPRWAVAYKLPALQAHTRVLDIVVNVGRTGALTPLAHLAPVQLGGVCVSRATLHNEDELRRKDVRVGDWVVVQRAGDVIPEVVKVIEAKRKQSLQPFVFPTDCPECGSRAVRKPGEAVWRCPNEMCYVRIKESIRHFASRKAMDIDGLGPERIALFLCSGLLKADEGVAGLYAMNREELMALDGFQEKSADKLLLALDESRNRSLSRFLFGLGIRHVGQHIASLVASDLFTLAAVVQADYDRFIQIHGVGEEVARSLVDYFERPEVATLLKLLNDRGVVAKESAKKPRQSARFDGQKIVVTGTLRTLSRSQAQALIESHGGQISSSVSKKTSWVLCGDKAGSKKDKALKLGVKVLQEDEFYRLLPS
jgi:DNA ligase (NAD+)